MMRSRSEGDSRLEQSLKRLEHDLEWNQERAGLVRERIGENIRSIKKRRVASKLLIAIATLLLVISIPIIVVDQQEVVVKEENLYQAAPNTEKNADADGIILDSIYQVFPLNAEKYIDAIVGEPLISEGGIYGAYYYQLGNRTPELLHITTYENEYPIEQRMEMLLPHKKSPSASYESKEILVGTHRAVLTVSNQEYGGVTLLVVTDNYVYTFSPPFQFKDITDKEAEQLEEDIVELAKLLTFK
ncbi:hypothetical protein LG307_03755 [Sutcliffiella horikoshii]|uniref:hypothetical protein n=1 Tax=Sutcliffiella horikoshii TaxID=79883 RepID=UPI00384E5615